MPAPAANNIAIIEAWQDGTTAFVRVLVPEGPPRGNVEYTGSTPLVDAQGNAKTVAVLKAEVAANIRAQRDASWGAAKTNAPTITGTVNV